MNFQAKKIPAFKLTRDAELGLDDDFTKKNLSLGDKEYLLTTLEILIQLNHQQTQDSC